MSPPSEQRGGHTRGGSGREKECPGRRKQRSVVMHHPNGSITQCHPPPISAPLRDPDLGCDTATQRAHLRSTEPRSKGATGSLGDWERFRRCQPVSLPALHVAASGEGELAKTVPHEGGPTAFGSGERRFGAGWCCRAPQRAAWCCCGVNVAISLRVSGGLWDKGRVARD